VAVGLGSNVVVGRGSKYAGAYEGNRSAGLEQSGVYLEGSYVGSRIVVGQGERVVVYEGIDTVERG